MIGGGDGTITLFDSACKDYAQTELRGGVVSMSFSPDRTEARGVTTHRLLYCSKPTTTSFIQHGTIFSEHSEILKITQHLKHNTVLVCLYRIINGYCEEVAPLSVPPPVNLVESNDQNLMFYVRFDCGALFTSLSLRKEFPDRRKQEIPPSLAGPRGKLLKVVGYL